MSENIGRATKYMRLAVVRFVCPLALVAGCGAGGVASSRALDSHATRSKSSKPDLHTSRHVGEQSSSKESFERLQDEFRDSPVVQKKSGLASYYADSLSGHAMANGEPYDPALPLMAHRTLPFGTIVRVVRISTGAAVIVRVTDRGPFAGRRRVADLSREAARRLGMIRDGVVEVRLEVLNPQRKGD